jgi:hypothetical protein
MTRARYWRGPTDINFRSASFGKVVDPKELGDEVEAENTEGTQNQEDEEDEGAEEGKKKNKALTTEQLEKVHAMHEVGHAAVATVLGCDVLDIRFSKWTGGGLTRAHFDKSRLSVPDRVTVLVAGGVAERMLGASGGDGDDIAEARRLGSDEQIRRARVRAKEILRANWGGCLAICDALQKWPLIKGSLVRTLLEAARAPRGLTTRIDEDIVTQRFEVARTGTDGRRRRVGKVCLIGRHWHAYRGYQNNWCGMYENYLDATRAI